MHNPAAIYLESNHLIFFIPDDHQMTREGRPHAQLLAVTHRLTTLILFGHPDRKKFYAKNDLKAIT
jgi:hypothetical protein